MLLGLQVFLLLRYGAPVDEFLSVLSRLKFLFLFLVSCNAFFQLEPFVFSSEGFFLGITMSIQILVVVLASQVVRTLGGKDAFLKGLRTLKVAPLFAYSLDGTLALLDGAEEKKGSGGGRGSGSGSGGGSGGGTGAGRRSAFGGNVLQAVRRGDFTPFYQKISQTLRRAEDRA